MIKFSFFISLRADRTVAYSGGRAIPENAGSNPAGGWPCLVAVVSCQVLVSAT
jgi:hypothetical protein